MTLKKSIFLFLLLVLTAACQQPPKKEEASQSEPDNKSDKVLDYFKSRQPTQEQLMAEAKKRNIKFEIHSANKNLELYIDRNLMDKVYFNLLSNAFKFTPDNWRR